MEQVKELDMTRESEAVQKEEWKSLKKFINDIFEKNGYPRVPKFAKAFSDGSKSPP